MGKIRLLFLVLAGILLFTQCADDDDSPGNSLIIPIPQQNTALPTNVDQLRILAIGNSFTDDCVHYLSKIVYDAGIDLERVCVYVASRPSYSLAQWCKVCTSNEVMELKRPVGALQMRSRGSATDLFKQDWDIIVFQQYSAQSDRFSSFNPYLSILTQMATKHCTNPNVCIAWHQTWNWRGPSEYGINGERYKKIVEASRQMQANNGIQALIPSGTAIENARSSSLQTKSYLTRDGKHLAFGTGCYVAACTWFQKLFKPAFNVDIRETSFKWKITDQEWANSKYTDAKDVTDENYRLCQECAIKALQNPFGISSVK